MLDLPIASFKGLLDYNGLMQNMTWNALTFHQLSDGMKCVSNLKKIYIHLYFHNRLIK